MSINDLNTCRVYFYCPTTRVVVSMSKMLSSLQQPRFCGTIMKWTARVPISNLDLLTGSSRGFVVLWISVFGYRHAWNLNWWLQIKYGCAGINHDMKRCQEYWREWWDTGGIYVCVCVWRGECLETSVAPSLHACSLVTAGYSGEWAPEPVSTWWRRCKLESRPSGWAEYLLSGSSCGSVQARVSVCCKSARRGYWLSGHLVCWPLH
jgi:hypothetical protein